MNEIPFNISTALSGFFFDYDAADTGRRFNRISGQYVEVPRFSGIVGTGENPEYEYAEFGEYQLDFKNGKARVNRITIIYARISTDLQPCHET